jgi:hypothetical protein
MGCFKLVGPCALVAGDNELTIEVRYPRPRSAEKIQADSGGFTYYYPQFHLFGCKLLVIGRWR